MDGTGTPAPRPLGDETEHYWRVLRMAKATGVDLVRARRDGAMTQDDWAGIVTRCRGCQWVDGCDRWLNKPTMDIRQFPEGCLNRERLAALQVRVDDKVS